MAIINKSSPTFYERQRDAGTVVRTNYSDIDSSVNTPPKVKGAFLTFADGSKFRRATNYGRSTFSIGRGAAEDTQHKRNLTGRLGYERSSAGGSEAGNTLTSGNMRYSIGAPVVAEITTPPVISASQRNEAVTKALNDIADSKAAIGENLATLRQTLNLVREPLTSLTGSLKLVRENKSFWPLLRLSYRDIVRGRGLDKVAQEYLKYVYGWKPLMQDIYGLMELAKEYGDTPLLVHGRGQSRQEPTVKGFEYATVSRGTVTTSSCSSASSRVTCSLWARIDPNYSGIRTLNQLGLLNPASLAWEFVPYSFVVDWVLPIGPVLQAFTAPAGLAFVDGSIAARASLRGSYTQAHNPPSGYTVFKQSAATGQWGYDGYKRETLANWPLPGLWFDSDPLRLNKDGSDRVFKALALTLLKMPRL